MKYKAGDKVRIKTGRYRDRLGEVYSSNSHHTAPYEYGVKFPYKGEMYFQAYNGDELELMADTRQETASDNVNHPSHYTWLPNGLEVIQLTEHMNFNTGNAVKYLCRAGRKDPVKHLEDLSKALWYVQREIKRVTDMKAENK